MKNILIYPFLLLVSLSVNGQNDFPCKEVLESEIQFLGDSFSSNQIAQLQTFNRCYLDSIDVEILWKGPLIGILLVEAGMSGNKITYQYVLNYYEKFKQTSDYLQIRQIYALAGGPVGNPMPQPPQKEASAEMRKPIVSEAIDYEKLLFQSKKEKKPVLLFFTGFACVNAVKMEKLVLSDHTVLEIIHNNFIFKQLYVDDKTTLGQEIVAKEGRVIKTVGHKNIDFQTSRFQNNFQPYFVIVDEKDQIIDQIGFVNIEKFKAFLEKGMRGK